MSAVTDDRAAIDEARAALEAEQNGGQTIEEMASDTEVGEQEELFPVGTVAGDPKTTLRNLIRAGVPTKLTCSLSRAEVPLTGGLISFEEDGEALVTYEAGKLEIVPEVERDENTGKRKLKGVKFRQNLRSVYVRPAGTLYTREQVLDMFDRLGVSADKVSEMLGNE